MRVSSTGLAAQQQEINNVYQSIQEDKHVSIIKNTYSWRNAICASSLSTSTKCVLFALSTYMSEQGDNCFPSISRLAKDASVCKRQAAYSIKEAIEKGFLVKESRKDGKVNKTNLYQANIPGVVHTVQGGSAPHAPGVVHHMHPNKPLVTNQRTNQSSCIIGDDTCNPETQKKPAQSNSPPIDSAGKRKRVKVDYSSEFEELWKLYPRRTPNDCKDSAFKAYNKRLKDGYTHDEMMVGVKSYLSYVKAVDKVGTEFVKMAATFLGPKKDFLKKWPIPEDKKNGWEGVL